MTNPTTPEQPAQSIEDSGYRFEILDRDGGDCLVRITSIADGFVAREFHWPSYKRYNILAHASDIAYEINAGMNDPTRQAR